MNRFKQIRNHLISSNKTASIATSNQGPYVVLEPIGQLIKLKLNRPKQLNLIDAEVTSELDEAVKEINRPHYKLCVFQGTGKMFSVGGDLKELRDAPDLDTLLRSMYRYNQLIYRMSTLKPLTITIWDGLFAGVGVGISIFAPIKIVTEDAVFMMSQCKLGTSTLDGSSIFLSRLRKNIGYYIALTGNTLKGVEIYQAGIADHYILKKNIPLLVSELESFGKVAESLDDNQVKDAVKTIIKKYEENTPQTLEHEDKIDRIFSGGSLLEILDTLREEASTEPIVNSWLHEVEKGAPWSLFLSYNVVKAGKGLNLQQALNFELELIKKVKKEDLVEGVDCKLNRKGSTPKWANSLDDIKSFSEISLKEYKIYDFGKGPIE